MSYRIKVFSKDIPADEAQLLSGMERVVLRIQQHRLAILIGGLLLLAAVAGVGALAWLDHRQAKEALDLNLQAMRLYLNRPADQPAQADQSLKQAIALFRLIVEGYPKTPAAQLSLYHLGNALVQANDLGGAIEAYKKFIRAYGTNTMLLALVYQRLGYAYLLNGDRDQAVTAFSDAMGVPGALNKDQVLYELGKLEESLSRPEGALARYQDLMKGYPNSPFTSEAAVRIKALEAKKAPSEGKPPASSQAGKEGKGAKDGGEMQK